jgi:hypothetical protein
MKNKFIIKVASISKKASENNSSTIKDVASVATIGGLGYATGTAALKLARKYPKVLKSDKRIAAAVGVGGLVGDYAAVKLNNHFLDNHHTKQAFQANPYLEKISYKHKG